MLTDIGKLTGGALEYESDGYVPTGEQKQGHSVGSKQNGPFFV